MAFVLPSNIIHLIQAIWRNWSNKRNVELNKILDRTIWNIYEIVSKRLKSHASFIICKKRLWDVLLYKTGYIWTRTQLERRVQYDFSSCVRVQIYPVLYSKTSNHLNILNLENKSLFFFCTNTLQRNSITM